MQNKAQLASQRRGIRLFEREKEIKKRNKRAVAERAVWSWPPTFNPTLVQERLGGGMPGN
jgi:hypothetical protein